MNEEQHRQALRQTFRGKLKKGESELYADGAGTSRAGHSPNRGVALESVVRIQGAF